MQSSSSGSPLSATTAFKEGLPVTHSRASLSMTGTSPLKLSKHSTTYAVPPGAGVNLSRRQSACYNHVKTSSLVSSSPFKTGNTTQSSQQPSSRTATRTQHAPQQVATRAQRRSISGERKGRKSDENKPSDAPKKPRQSKGLQTLGKTESVSKSPFLEANRSPSTPPRPDRSQYVAEATSIVKSSSLPIAQVAVPALSPPRQNSLPNLAASQVPMTPPKASRVSDFNSPATTATPNTPRSSLVSKRLIGPRSQESPLSDNSLKRSRRKTVTWDERCDVVEFDQEDSATEILSDAEERGDSDQPIDDDDEWPPHIPDNRSVSKEAVDHVMEEWFGSGGDVSHADTELAEDMMSPDMKTVELYAEVEHIATYDDDFSNPEPPLDSRALSSIVEVDSVAGDRSSSRDLSSSTQTEIPNDHHIDAFRPKRSNEPSHRSFEHHSDFSMGYHDILKSANSRPHSFAGMSSTDFFSDHEALFTSSPRNPGQFNVSNSNQPSRISQNGMEVELGEVQSALDRLMIGVEMGFDPSINSNCSEISDDDDDRPLALIQRERSSEIESYSSPAMPAMLRESTAMSGASTQTTDMPATPQLDENAAMESILGKQSHSAQVSKELPQLPPASPASIILSLDPPPSLGLGDYTGSSRLTAPFPPAPVRRSTIRRHEEAIKAKRREQRAAEGRPTRRRSLSTGDDRVVNLSDRLELPLVSEADFGDVFDKEVAKIYPKKSYMLKERKNTIYASDRRVSNAGDLHGGKAWKVVRRPSDMNEHSKQIKQYQAQEPTTKTNGKVFVKVIGFRALDIPLPAEPTYFTCILNNGIHFVETPATLLARESSIEQEFELIEHEKLEFTLTIKIRKDAHINRILNPPPAAPSPVLRAETPPVTKGGMRNFFSSPKKITKVEKKREPVPVVIGASPFGRYLKKDLSIARSFISFKEIAKRCDAKLFETSFPMVGQYSEPGKSQLVTKTIGEMVLQIFRLPPISGVPVKELPQSLEECHRGLRHVHWHKVVYHEGVLTQLGGDCSTWRRRTLRVMGASLIAYNDITKKPIATVDLRKVIRFEDGSVSGRKSPVSPELENNDRLNVGRVIRKQTSFNALQGIEHSFRLIFESDEICFYADTAEEKAGWFEIFEALIGRIPSNPLWAELLWQQQQQQKQETQEEE